MFQAIFTLIYSIYLMITAMWLPANTESYPAEVYSPPVVSAPAYDPWDFPGPFEIPEGIGGAVDPFGPGGMLEAG